MARWVEGLIRWVEEMRRRVFSSGSSGMLAMRVVDADQLL